MDKIVIIEDEPSILLALKDELSRDYEVYAEPNGQLGLSTALKKDPNLVLLDILLPDIDGYEVCRKLREEGIDAAIIMLTAKDQVEDKVKGLELGADDYLTKPFSFDELKARIKAVTRRRSVACAQGYDDGCLKIDFTKYRATRNNKSLKLSCLEFKLLRYLVSKKQQLISRQELLEEVWGYASSPSTRTVDVHILSLRKKIGRKYISTFHKQGYKFENK